MEQNGRNRQTPKNYGGSYTVPESEEEQVDERPRKFVLKEKIREMLQYGMPLVDSFPRRARKLADTLRDSMVEMLRLATRLELKYYKKTTIEDLNIELAVLREFVIVASDRRYHGEKYAPPLTMHQREVWGRYNREIGCLIGGYKKAFESKGAK